MARTFKEVFSLYKPDFIEQAAIEKITALSLKVDKDMRLIEATAAFSEYISYETLVAIENKVKECYTLNGMRVKPTYQSETFSVSKFGDIIEELKRRRAQGNGFFANAVISNGSSDFNEADVSCEGDTIFINLKNGGKKLLEISSCDKILSDIISEWFDIEKKIEFTGQTSLDFDQYRQDNPLPTFEYHPAIHTESKEEQAASVQNSFGRGETSAAVNFEEGICSSGKMRFDINDMEIVSGKFKTVDSILPIRNITLESPRFVICGEIFDYQKKDTRSGEKCIVSFFVTDNDASCILKMIYDKEKEEQYSKIKNGAAVMISGGSTIDKFDGSLIVKPAAIALIKRIKRKDNAEKKRVELHLHTTLSTMDATLSPPDLVKQVLDWGRPPSR